jgi:hypothetical protein
MTDITISTAKYTPFDKRSSWLAQRKRVGLITQRSKDRNLRQLNYLLHPAVRMIRFSWFYNSSLNAVDTYTAFFGFWLE